MPRRIITILLLLTAAGLRAQLPLSYAYVRPIVITNPNSTAIPNLQMEFDLATNVLVSSGKMQADGDDISFWDSCQELFYWIEDSSFNTTRTTFWVKIPLVPPGTHTIYMYYGDPSAAANPHRNGDITFVFFDDFNTGSSPNPAKWSLVSNNGNDVHTLNASGHYVLSANPSNAATGLKHAMAAGNYEVGSKFRIDSVPSAIDFDPEVGWFPANVLNTTRIATWVSDDEYPHDYTGAGGTGTLFNVYSQPIRGRWSYPRVRTIGNQVTARRFSYIPTFFDETGPTLNFPPANVVNLYIGSSAYQGEHGAYDFIFVRNAVANEPSLSLQAESPNPWTSLVTISGDTILCPGDQLLLTASSVPGGNYTWTGPQGILSTQQQLSLPSAPVGVYSVMAELTGACSSDSVQVLNVVFAPAEVDELLCSGGSVTLGDPPLPGVTYQWSSVPPGFSSASSPVTVTPSVTTAYILTQSSTTGACSVTDTILVTVSTSPVAAFTLLNTTGELDVTFNNQSQNAVSYAWSYGDGGFSSQFEEEHAYATGGNYMIMLVATNADGCTDTAWSPLELNVESTLYVPNAFTPDGDGLNETFSVSTSNMESIDVEIYDRWGHLITSWSTLNGSWDGTMKGNPCQVGVYVWVVHAEGFDGKQYAERGHVSLIR